ncbi:MAG: hypothetical protein JRG96_11455 [Deltaproteobacteria bacterium]|nr:hypothetical protein [Deltaproteobacteria bacterium]MBW2418962.1 hypothetical protein [Deltaproteobacteria bacterium]
MSAGIGAHIRRQAISNAFFNTLINGWVAWLLIKENPVLPLWGAPSVAVDLVATGFLLPFIIALIVIPLNRRDLRKGKFAVLRLDPSIPLHRWLGPWPRSLPLRALLFGLIGALVVAPLTILVFVVLGIDPIAPMHFAVFKGFWAGALAGVMVVPMATLALATPD